MSADESVDKPIVELLGKDGHDGLYLSEMEPSIRDEVVLQRANEHYALLVSADNDFDEQAVEMSDAFTVISSGMLRIRHK